MKENISISIVIPVYNIEKYIHKCLTSAVNQTFSAYEVIVILDGPTDGSSEICKRISLEHSEVKIIEQENRGLAAARNQGIRCASGDYIYFIDGDDYILPDTLESFVKLIQTYGKADYIHGRMSGFYENEEQLDQDTYYLDNVWLPGGGDGQSAFVTILKHQNHLKMGVRGLYRRQFLLENHLFFLEKKGSWPEDEEWTVRVFYFAKKVIGNKNACYCYRYNRPGSEMSKLGTLSAAREHINIYSGWMKLSYRPGADPEFADVLRAEAGRRFFWCTLRYTGILKGEELREFINAADGHTGMLSFFRSPKMHTRVFVRMIRILGLRYSYPLIKFMMKLIIK